MRSGSPVGTTDREFRIASDGTISVAGNLDYETTRRYELTVRATYDADGETTTTSDQTTENVQVVIDVELIKLVDADDDPVSSYTASVDEDAANNASVVMIDASVDGASADSTIAYVLITTGTPFQIDASGDIYVALPALLDYETTPRYELTVQINYDADGSILTTDDRVSRNGVQVVIDVGNVDDGTATYEIMQSTTALAENTVLTARLLDGLDANEDPDGVESGSIRYQWFADGVEIDGATSSTYTIGSTVATTYSVRITYLDGYNAGLAPADQMRTEVIASTSPIKLMQDGSQVLSYTASVDEDASAGTSVVTIDASVDGDAQGSAAIDYDFLVSGSLSNVDAGTFFRITSYSGEITVLGLGTLDYETATSHTLTVRVTYDADGSSTTTSDQETRDVQVVITVNDVPGASPAIIPDRQAFAHHDPMGPDDLGLTPMPDADPSAG